ncbi:MAG: nucleoside recognition domain-containing protein [Thermacetogeniaceae bacterium]|jgi:sporulation integral membrane protein YlbJ
MIRPERTGTGRDFDDHGQAAGGGSHAFYATLFWILVCLLLGAGIIRYPVAALAAAHRGLLTWWEIVLPSLLPFFIVSELLMGLGFVSLLGRLLEPVMRPLFNLPGSAGFVIAVSYTSGFPLCAVLTSRIRSDHLCTRNEGERLMAFTSNASPLFMLGAISVGMYRNPALGPLIAGIHYLSNLLCGMLLRFTSQSPSGLKPDERLKQGLAPRVGSLLRASRLEKQNFGSLLGETVQKTSIILLTIGGFITIFSVLIGIMEAAGFFNTLITALAPVAGLFHIDVSLLRALMYGLFEITIGINEVSKSSGSFVQQLLVIETLLAWNGLAVQAQVAGMMVGSDLRLWLYLLTRCLQVPIAVLIAYMVTLLPVRDYLTGCPLGAALATGPAASWFPWVAGLCVPAGIVLALFTGYTLNKWWVRLKKIIIIR